MRSWLIGVLLAMPLAGWQASDKPSPVPTKPRRLRPSGPVQKKPNPAETGAAKPANTGLPPDGRSPQLTGQACFFSSSADGSLTAGGQPLNSEELVAGHASFPLGSRVKVTNLANQRTVEVLIVDRFPASNRIINVSEAAARQLDFIRAGTAEVRLELLGPSVGK